MDNMEEFEELDKILDGADQVVSEARVLRGYDMSIVEFEGETEGEMELGLLMTIINNDEGTDLTNYLLPIEVIKKLAEDLADFVRLVENGLSEYGDGDENE